MDDGSTTRRRGNLSLRRNNTDGGSSGGGGGGNSNRAGSVAPGERSGDANGKAGSAAALTAPPLHMQYTISRAAFLCAVCAVYCVAFGSLFVQVPGLYGERGLLPLSRLLEQPRTWQHRALAALVGWLRLSPAAALGSACLLGACLAARAALRARASAPLLLLLFALYSFAVGCGQVFLAFQWDELLLEVGFVAALYAPWRPRPVDPSAVEGGSDRPAAAAAKSGGRSCWSEALEAEADAPPSTAARLALRWALFKLMLMSGAVKLQSQTPGAGVGTGMGAGTTWEALTALHYHFATQCIPTPIAWYLAQGLPQSALQLGVVFAFVVELPATGLLLLPTATARRVGVGVQLLLQLLIALSGNYGFFNLLTAALALALVDDGVWHFVLRLDTPPTAAAEIKSDAAGVLASLRGAVLGAGCDAHFPRVSRMFSLVAMLLSLVAAPLAMIKRSTETQGGAQPPVVGTGVAMGAPPRAAYGSFPLRLGFTAAQLNGVLDGVLPWLFGIVFSASLLCAAFDILGDGAGWRPLARRWHEAVAAAAAAAADADPAASVAEEGPELEMVTIESAESGSDGVRAGPSAPSDAAAPPGAALTPAPLDGDAGESELDVEEDARLLSSSHDGAELGGASPNVPSCCTVQRSSAAATSCAALLSAARAIACVLWISAALIPFRTISSARPPTGAVLELSTYAYDQVAAPLHLTAGYGLFRTMTGVGSSRFDEKSGLRELDVARPELIIEGSSADTVAEADRASAAADAAAAKASSGVPLTFDSDVSARWRPYEFRYKPGGLHRPPPWVAPHMPRLDWQLWFAALEPRAAYAGKWFNELVYHLLAGSPDVLSLIGTDGVPVPFRPPQGRPPRWLRVRRWRYDFALALPLGAGASAGSASALPKTSAAASSAVATPSKVATAAQSLWWRRGGATMYLEPVSLDSLGRAAPLAAAEPATWALHQTSALLALLVAALLAAAVHAVAQSGCGVFIPGGRRLANWRRGIAPWVAMWRLEAGMRGVPMAAAALLAVLCASLVAGSSGHVIAALLLVELAGLVISRYMAHVEEASSLMGNAFQAKCDLSNRVSCTKAATSKYGRMFFGIPNAKIGVLVFAGLLGATALYSITGLYAMLLISQGAGMFASAFSIYLAFVSFVVQKNMCIVCIATYLVSFALCWVTTQSPTVPRLHEFEGVGGH